MIYFQVVLTCYLAATLTICVCEHLAFREIFPLSTAHGFKSTFGWIKQPQILDWGLFGFIVSVSIMWPVAVLFLAFQSVVWLWDKLKG